MSKRDNRRVNLNDYKASKAEEGSIEIETDDGTVFVIPPAVLWPDHALQLAGERKVVEAAKALLGDDRYDEFVAKGGSAQIVFALIKDDQGLNAGE